MRNINVLWMSKNKILNVVYKYLFWWLLFFLSRNPEDIPPTIRRIPRLWYLRLFHASTSTGRGSNLLWQTLLHLLLSHQAQGLDLLWWCHCKRSGAPLGTGKSRASIRNALPKPSSIQFIQSFLSTYEPISNVFEFSPFVDEIFGPGALGLLKNISKDLVQETGDQRAGEYIICDSVFCIPIVRGSVATVLLTFPLEEGPGRVSFMFCYREKLTC